MFVAAGTWSEEHRRGIGLGGVEGAVSLVIVWLDEITMYFFELVLLTLTLNSSSFSS